MEYIKFYNISDLSINLNGNFLGNYNKSIGIILKVCEDF